MSYLETLRVGTVSVFTGLAVLYKEVDQVETADDGDESSEEILPRLTDILETAYRDRETRDEEGKAYNKREDAVQTEEAINETSYKANDEGTERIAPVFTATCTTTEVLVLDGNTFLEILEDTFFLHESFSCLWVDISQLERA